MGQTSVQVFSNLGVIWQQRSCVKVRQDTNTLPLCPEAQRSFLLQAVGGEPAEATQHQLS